jgi:hypothetical protein
MEQQNIVDVNKYGNYFEKNNGKTIGPNSEKDKKGEERKCQHE